MAITKYSELDAAVDNWMKRTDLASRISEFIAQTESRMWYGDGDEVYGNEPLRVSAMQASSDLTITSGQAAKPTDFLEGIRMYVASGGINQEIQYYPPTDFWQRGIAQTAGIPVAYTIEGSNFEFGTPATGTPKLLYYKKLTALDSTDSESTNDILTSNPNIYLWGTLALANLYIMEYEAAANYARMFRGAIDGWNTADRRERMIGPLRARPAAVA